MASRTDEWIAMVLTPLLPTGALDPLLQDESPTSLWERVLATGLLSESAALHAVAARCKLPIADLQRASADVVDTLPEPLARRYGVVPLAVSDTHFLLATCNPLDFGTEQALAFATGRAVRLQLASPQRIREKLDEIYGEASRDGSVREILAGLQELGAGTEPGEEQELDAARLAGEASSAPIVRLAGVLLADGIGARASDIHIESGERSVLVRYRIDGVLQPAMTIPRKAGVPLISRIKIMSGLDIADRLRPQDGRARIEVNGRTTDLRVSTLPAIHGEKVVIRVLNAGATTMSLESLGLYPDERATIERLLACKEGIVLCTGPTGSGKTTTLYSCVRAIDDEGLNIVTVEDPVEYHLGRHIVQVQTNERAGLTFATVLRSILRQDPDVVLVGEIRDLETAQVAVQASLTGHLVLSTLHTNDAPNAVTRLADMGLEAFKLGASLRGVIAQRLMRRLCASCRSVEAADDLPEPLRVHVPRGTTLWRAVGCSQCAQTGYRGRFSAVEILVMDPALGRAVGKGEGPDGVTRLARAGGMRTLFECGLRHVIDGETSIAELLRIASVPKAGSIDAIGEADTSDPLAGLELVDDPACATLSSVP
ncbi:MAG: GspE/PulE family protein [Gemmatimonadota bacterium]